LNLSNCKNTCALLFFSRTSRPNSIKLGTNHPSINGMHICANKGPGPLQRGDNHKNVKTGWGHLKTFFSRTTVAILTRLGTNLPWWEGIQIYSNERDCHSPREDNNNERVKIHCKFLKIFFSRTSRPNSIKLGTNYPWENGMQVCSNKGPGPLQRGDNHKNVKIGSGLLN
jgi:hypothetical protein